MQYYVMSSQTAKNSTITVLFSGSFSKKRSVGSKLWGSRISKWGTRRQGGGVCPIPRKKISILDLKLANFGANWALFVQFT